MAAKTLSGADKAAILLLSLGEDLASEIMSRLSKEEVRRIGAAMSRLGRIEQTQLDAVAGEFHDQLVNHKKSLVGNSSTAQRLLALSGNIEDAAAMGGAIDLTTTLLTETLSHVDAKVLAAYLSREHPQTAAIVLAHCAPKQGGEVLRLIPTALQGEVVQRIARLSAVDPESLEAIITSIKEEVERHSMNQGHKVGGVDKLIALVNGMDKAGAERLLEDLEARDPDLAARVREAMFTFADLVKVRDRGIQVLLGQVPQATLRLALKGAPIGVADHIYKNMSQRAAQLLQADVAALPKTRLSDVEAAQKQVAALALKLAEAGKLEIASKDEQYV